MRKLETQLNEYLDYCEKVRRMTKQTLYGRKFFCRRLLREFDIESIEDITNQQINEWIAAMADRGCNGRTTNTNIARLKSLLRYFLDMGVVIPNLKIGLIVKQKEVPPRRAYYTREQIEEVLGYANRIEWLLIRIAFDCGLRVTELTNLRLSNFHGQRVNFIGKGQKSREAYISEEAREKLDKWIKSENITDYLWITQRKVGEGTRHLSVDEVRHLMKKTFEKAGYTDFYPHALRHSFATDIVNNGAPMEVAKEMLGHSNLATTERYVHSFDGHLSDYFQKYKFAH